MNLLIVVFLSAASAAYYGWRFRNHPDDAPYLWASLIAHLVAPHVFLMIVRTVYAGVADQAEFFLEGRALLEHYDFNPEEALDRALFAFSLGPTARMNLIAALGLLLFDSEVATNVACSVLAFSGQFALMRAMMRVAAPSDRAAARFTALLVPSVVFWSGAFVKEAFAVFGLGWALDGWTELMGGGRSPRAVTRLVVGVIAVGLIKPYVLLPLALGIGSLHVATEANFKALARRPLRALAAVVGAVLLTALVPVIFPELSAESLSDQSARVSGYADGGSAYSLSRVGGESPLLAAPVALFAALFRPFIFEAHNITALLNSIETTVFLLLLFRAVQLVGLRRMLERTLTTPSLLMPFVIVLTLGTATGLVSGALGTLSRYRVPMIPFYVFWLVAVGRRVVVREPSPSPPMPTELLRRAR